MKLFVVVALVMITIDFLRCLMKVWLCGVALKKERRTGYSQLSINRKKRAVAMLFIVAVAIVIFIECAMVPVLGRHKTPFDGLHYVCVACWIVACIGAIAQRPIAMNDLVHAERIDWHHLSGYFAMISGMLAGTLGLLREFWLLK